MKKLLAMALALAMIFCLGIPAFAADETPADTTTIIINEPDTVTKDRDYNAYKLFDLKVSHKDAGHGYNCPDPINHVAECYNYAYTISNDNYRTILQKEVYDKTENSFWTDLNTTRPDAASQITDEQILTYISKLQGDNGSDYRTLRKTTDRIYADILAAGLAADETLETGRNTGIAQGYWLIVDVTENMGNKYDAYSVALLNTKGEQSITINPKVSLPELEKKVKDINDSQHSDSKQHDWTDVADYDIGDEIPFKLTATLPNNMDSFTAYQMIFNDIMDSGLSIVEDSIQVYLYANKALADADTDMADGTEIAISNDPQDNISYSITNAQAFTVTIKDAKQITKVVGDKTVHAEAGNAIVVLYRATLETGAELGKPGNENRAFLEFSNNPYSDSMGKTAEDKVVVFTYGLTINKIDNLRHALKGAGFTLYKQSKKDADEYVAVGSEVGGKDGDVLREPDRTTFEWTGLDDGNYMLVETTVPEGFNKMEPLYFTITSSLRASDTPDLLSVTFSNGLKGNADLDSGIFEENIVNNTGTVLPSTGAEGTFFLITAGALLVVVACVFMITRKKMSVYED